MTEVKPVSVALVILSSLAVVAALYFGREFLVPIGFAAVLSVALRPVVRRLKAWGVKPAFGGAGVVLVLMAALGTAGWFLAGPVKAWVGAVPAKLEAAQARLERLRAPVRRMTEVANRLERETGPGGGGGATTQPASQPTVAQQAVRESATSRPAGGEKPASASTKPAAVAAVPEPVAAPTEARGGVAGVLGALRRVVWEVTEVFILLYLLLAGDELFIRKTIKVIPRFTDKENAARAAAEIEAVVLGYLRLALTINAGQGVVVGLTMWLLGVPGPVLWGLATVVMEFVPYLGATVMIASLALVALATIDSAGHALAVPLSYLVIATVQSSVVSPYAYGNRLKLNPVAVFLGVLFWWFVWGVPGAFLAVPIIATAKVVADRVEGWRGVGEFLGE